MSSAMRIAFAGTTSALWGVVAVTITYAILDSFSWLALVLLSAVTAILGVWLGMHRNELRNRYETAEALAAVPGPYDKQVWRHKPKLRELAPALAVGGFCSIYFAYRAAHGNVSTGIVKLIYEFSGVPGVVAFWALAGVIMLSKALETIIGSRVKK